MCLLSPAVRDKLANFSQNNELLIPLPHCGETDCCPEELRASEVEPREVLRPAGRYCDDLGMLSVRGIATSTAVSC